MIKPELQVGSHLSGVTVIWQLWKKRQIRQIIWNLGNALNIMRWIIAHENGRICDPCELKQVPTLFKYLHHEHVNGRLDLNDLIF